MRGYVQVYTGNGKGKTTAALGLALRAAGAGLRVFIAQFAKGGEYSEIKALQRFQENIAVKQYGRGVFINGKPAEEDVRAARKGLAEARERMVSGEYDVVILDEANIATSYNLFSAGELLDFIAARPENVELVITGRSADPRVMEKADLVTEMKEIKHYFQKGVKGRDGIER
ncbi:MAG: cob(I)yrinic acid a,c-diamide adenosyltransferase [Deltaproteobacteria bacterium]|nr:cob(I)yrinic acid a,c-diamide adenosyltransferase [Deltaproteobacteria bacterium]MBN2687801.1 cob(I)yrinic acid a,c-diamide adenosyltransferase [Deltaproteobacteria bacterium]